MQTLRSLLFLLAQCVVTPFYAIIVLATFPFSAKFRAHVIRGWTWFFVWLADKLCGIKFKVIGQENIPANKSLIVACKHSSTWETLALDYMFEPASFIAKRELLWIPFFGWGFALSSPITINRSAGAEAMSQLVTQGQQRIKDGFNIVIFPEGTRIAAGKRGKYKTGAARLAVGMASAGAVTPVLPIAHNAGYCWPKKGFIKTPGEITLSILPALDPQNYDVAGLTAALEQIIETEVTRLGDSRFFH